MPGESKSSPRRIEARMRQVQALRLRMSGESFDEIARQLGYRSKQAAHYAVKAALRDVPKAEAEEYRRLDLERLDRLFLALFSDVIDQHMLLADRQRAAAECRAIIAERSKLLGNYAPTEVRVDVYQRVRELARQRGYTDAETEAAVAVAEEIERG